MADDIYGLMPEIIRERDEQLAASLGVAVGSAPLRDLLSIIQAELDALHGGIEQLYDDWFIETCAPWVVPYLGDLVGRTLIRPLGGDPSDHRRAVARSRILVPRRDVANTIAHRRRKGTLHILEEVARDVAGWPARASESYRLLGWNQHLDHLHADRGRSVDLRDVDALASLDGPFDRLAHRVDVREIGARPPRTQGRWNIPSVALHVWRLGSYPVTRARARSLDRESGNAYTFSVLGSDGPLFARPLAEPPYAIAREPERPVRISRHTLARHLDVFYGRGKSLLVEIGREVEDDQDGGTARATYEPIDPGEVLVTSLRRGDAPDEAGWPDLAWPEADAEHGRKRPRVAIDPESGRLMFRPDEEGVDRVRVSYHYGFSAAMGGGEYQRPVHDPASGAPLVFRLGAGERFSTFAQVMEAWRTTPADAAKVRPPAIIEIADSGVYNGPVDVALAAGESLQLRAAVGTRPVIRILDSVVDKREALIVSGRGGGCFSLDGVIVEGRGMEIRGDLAELRIRHTTLVPGWALDHECRPRHAGEASLRIRSRQTVVRIEQSILGPIHVLHNEVADQAIPITILDSIVDAHSADEAAVRRPTGGAAHAILEIRRSTVIGRLVVHAVELGEDSIFLGEMTVDRRQLGCLRFSYVPSGGRTPSRYRCQPDTALAALAAAGATDPFLEPRLVPRFTSLRYGNPTYAQLRLDAAAEIREGASDEAEMGAFHDLYQSQRIDNLRARVDESTPAAMDAGLIFVT